MQATEEPTSQAMPRPENRTYDVPEDALWAIYNRETEKVDSALVERCKENMNGLLIFAGLFSAVITAFIIESYKSLTPDSGETTVALLGQISFQLAAMANGSQYPLPNPSAANTTFTATRSAVRVNACWFISLSLSLATALAATLVQQWVRYYQQAINRREVPRIRARIRSFLYTGVESFRLLAIVDAIPALLHLAVFVFLAGLVEFLSPLNGTVKDIVLAILALLGVLYAVISILPVFRRDCPYHSPLTGAFWVTYRVSGSKLSKYVHLFNLSWRRLCSPWTFREPVTSRELTHRLVGRCRNGLGHCRSLLEHTPGFLTQKFKAAVKAWTRVVDRFSSPSQNSFPEAQEADALSLESGRQTRETVALRWTLDSLTDHSELGPFLKALPAYADMRSATGEDLTMRMNCLEQLFAEVTERAGRLLHSYRNTVNPRPHDLQCIKAAVDFVDVYTQLEGRVPDKSLQMYADVLTWSLLRPMMHFALWRSGVTDIEHHTHCIYLWMLSIPSLSEWLWRKYQLPWPNTPEGLRAFKMLEKSTEDSYLLAGLVLLLYVDYLYARTEMAAAPISRTTFDRLRTRAFPYGTAVLPNRTFRSLFLSIVTRAVGARGHPVNRSDQPERRRIPNWMIKEVLEICIYTGNELELQPCRVTILALNLILQKGDIDPDVKLEAKNTMDRLCHVQEYLTR